MVCISLGGVVELKNFELDEFLDWHPNTYTEWNTHLNKEVITDEDLLEVLKGKGNCSSMGSDDGPEFKKLREHLGQVGYIRIQRGWWNGDRVLKPFKLNGVKFEADDQFSCGAAMKFHLEFARKDK